VKILFVNQYYWPDLAATAQQMSDLCEDLAGRGHEVHVVCSRGAYDDGSGKPTPKRETRRGVHIHRVSAPGFGKKSTLGRVIDYAGFHLLTGLWLLALGWRFRAIVTLTTPPLIGIYATLVKWLTLGRTRHVCWAMDLHPDLEFDLGLWSPKHPLYRFFYWLNNLHFRHASAVVALGACMAERMRDKAVRDDRLHVISVWNRADEVQPLPPGASPLRTEHGFDDKFVVMYSGNAGIIHTFDAACEAMRRLAGDRRIAFLFVGGGRRLDEIERFVAEHKLTNFTRLPYFPRERLSESLAMGDVHLVTMRDRMQGVAVPCKTYGIMAAARAVLFVGPTDADTARHIRAGEAGFVFAGDDADGLVDAIRRLADDRDEAAAIGRRGRDYFLAHHEQRVCCDQWIALLESLADRVPARTESASTIGAAR